MTVGSFNLTVFSSALFCFGSLVANPSHAAPQRPWYLAAFDRVLRVVSSDGQDAQLKDVEKQLQQASYTSRIAKQESTITLTGDVPSESDVRILQGVAAATSPGAAVTDKSRLNPNISDRDSWLAAMTFALRQLGKLEHGSAVLRNSSIAIEGVTKAGDDFAVVQKKLRDEAPKGLNLQVALKPHDVHPFVWLAQLQPGVLTLSGHVPDQQDVVLCNHAQDLFRNLQVKNGMEFAKGEPRDWLSATKLALDMLALLYTGNAAVSDNVIKLEGIYSSPAMVDLLKSYSQRLPKGFRLETNILEPVARAPAARVEDVNLAAHNIPASMSP
jgi:OOP family OmpA-OmpF porin